MTTLIGLPEEIIAHICSSLVIQEGGLNPLLNLSRCCWMLRRIAEDALYHTVELYSYYSEEYSIPLLIRTLLDRPTLATKIRKLVVGVHASFDYRHESGEWDESVLSYFYDRIVFGGDTLVAACIDKIVKHKAYEPTRAFWIIGLTQRHVTAFVGFLLSLLPNLHDLDLSVAHKETAGGGTSQVLTKLFISGAYPRTIDPLLIQPWVDFSKVKRLCTFGWNLEILALDFSSLQELELDLVEGGAENRHDETEPFTCSILRSSTIIPPYPQLRRLRLCTDWEDLETHLEAPKCASVLFELVRCTNLTTVEFRLEHGPRNCGDNRLGSWNAIIEDLYPAHGTIESLTLDVVGDRHWYFDLSRLSQFDPIESICHFSRLRQLTLPQSALFSDDNLTRSDTNLSAFLPLSLQNIIIKWPTGNIIGWLKNVAVAKSSGTLGVQRIVLVCDMDVDQPASWFYDMVPASTWDDIRNAGIEVEAIDAPGRRTIPPKID